ncbi:MAG: hypothetical protein WA957_08160, partial [Alteraurantiacibacter sp.]
MSGASQNSAQGAATDGRARLVETLRLRGEGLEAYASGVNSALNPNPVHAELVGLEEGAEPQPSSFSSPSAEKEKATVDPADQLRFRQAQGEREVGGHAKLGELEEVGEVAPSPFNPP